MEIEPEEGQEYDKIFGLVGCFTCVFEESTGLLLMPEGEEVERPDELTIAVDTVIELIGCLAFSVESEVENGLLMVPEGAVVERPDELTIAEKMMDELTSGAPHILALKSKARAIDEGVVLGINERVALGIDESVALGMSNSVREVSPWTLFE